MGGRPDHGDNNERLREATVGDLERHDDTVALAEYDPAWPDLYLREAERIRTALGTSALAVHHVGSTSVPGLPAKPVIDIVLTVSDSADEAAYVPALKEAGYVLRIREPDWYDHRLLEGPDTDVNLHVFSEGCPETDAMLAFRDRLRADDAERDRYARAKRELADRRWRYVQDYADAKSDVVRGILDDDRP